MGISLTVTGTGCGGCRSRNPVVTAFAMAVVLGGLAIGTVYLLDEVYWQERAHLTSVPLMPM